MVLLAKQVCMPSGLQSYQGATSAVLSKWSRFLLHDPDSRISRSLVGQLFDCARKAVKLSDLSGRHPEDLSINLTPQGRLRLSQGCRRIGHRSACTTEIFYDKTGAPSIVETWPTLGHLHADLHANRTLGSK